jgi:hypothetical protein
MPDPLCVLEAGSGHHSERLDSSEWIGQEFYVRGVVSTDDDFGAETTDQFLPAFYDGARFVNPPWSEATNYWQLARVKGALPASFLKVGPSK